MTFAEWTEGRPYSRTFTGTKGTPPYTWSLASGAFPVTEPVVAGTGKLEGPAAAAGDYTFEVRITDSVGARESRTFQMHVNAVPSVTTESLPAALIERPYTAHVAAVAGTGAYTWSVSGGSPPTGLVLDGSGVLSGTPSLVRSFSFEVQALDTCGATETRLRYVDGAPGRGRRGRRAFMLPTLPDRAAGGWSRPVWDGERVEELATRAVRQPLGGEGRAQEVAAQMLERLSGVSGQGDVGVKGEALQARATGLELVAHGGGRAKPSHRMTGPRAGGQKRLDGGGGRAGQERHLLGHRIARARLLGQAAPSAQELLHAVVDLLQELGDLFVGGRGQRVKEGGRLG